MKSDALVTGYQLFRIASASCTPAASATFCSSFWSDPLSITFGLSTRIMQYPHFESPKLSAL